MQDDKSTENAPSSNDRRRHSLTVCETPTRKKSDPGSTLEDEYVNQYENDQRIILSTQMSNMSMSATSATSISSISSTRSGTPVEVCDQLVMFRIYGVYKIIK